jgi:hypothetical protein
MAGPSGHQPQGCVDSKEIWMTWEISAAANAVIGIAYLVIAYIILGGLMRTNQLTTNRLRRQRPATVAGGDAPT